MASLTDLMFAPVRAIIGAAERDVHNPLEETERDVLGGVTAIERATDSIDRHVEVIEGLATSVGPLTDSVDRLTETMRDLVKILGPMAAAEHGVQHAEQEAHHAEHFFGFRRHRDAPKQPAEPPDPGPRAAGNDPAT
jgi:hypothetical protein